MREETIVKICKDYGVTATDLRIAGAVELTLQKSVDEDQKDINGVARQMSQMLNDTGMANAIRFATWVKHARENSKLGSNYDELLEIRQKGLKHA